MHQRLLQNPVHIQKVTTSLERTAKKTQSYNSKQRRRQRQAVIKSHHKRMSFIAGSV